MYRFGATFLMVMVFCFFMSPSIGAFNSPQSGGGAQAPATVQSQGAGGKGQNVHPQVVSIFLDKISGGYIYAKDGRKFALPSNVKITEHTNPATKKRIAQLYYMNSTLISVNIR